MIKNSLSQLKNKIIKSDIIFHLAGENRSKRNKDYYKNNFNLTKKITDIIISNNLKKKIIFSSSSQVLKNKNNIYSKTKLLSENEIKKCIRKTKSIVSIIEFQMFMENGLEKIIILYLQHLLTTYLDQKK